MLRIFSLWWDVCFGHETCCASLNKATPEYSLGHRGRISARNSVPLHRDAMSSRGSLREFEVERLGIENHPEEGLVDHGQVQAPYLILWGILVQHTHKN